MITTFPSDITDWTAYTPTSTWVINATHTGFYKRVKDTLFVRVQIYTTGAPTSTTLIVDTPADFTVDASKLTTNATNGVRYNVLGICTVRDSSSGISYTGLVRLNDSTTFYPEVQYITATFVRGTALSQTIPMTWASGDQISMLYQIPIL